MKTKPIHKSDTTRPAAKASALSLTKKVRFRIKHPTAKSLVLVGTFTQWEAQPVPLAELEPGVWEIEVELPNDRHEYLFLTEDGAWLQDPEAAASVANPFGGRNSVIHVTEL
jgi:1,4-alpha-glucan branching enzyme